MIVEYAFKEDPRLHGFSDVSKVQYDLCLNGACLTIFYKNNTKVSWLTVNDLESFRVISQEVDHVKM